jgi:hypothetical protein
MITQPLPFQEAIGFLLHKEDLPADWDAAMWQEQETDFRTKAFFSANVENARFLDRAHGLLFDSMAKVRETIVQPDGTVVTALKVSGREHFVKRMRDFMIAEGSIVCFERKDDAETYLRALPARLAKFGLQLAEEKSALVKFNRWEGDSSGRFTFVPSGPAGWLSIS